MFTLRNLYEKEYKGEVNEILVIKPHSNATRGREGRTRESIGGGS